MKRKREIKTGKAKNVSKEVQSNTEDNKPELPKVKNYYGKSTKKLGIFAGLLLLGVILIVFYFFNTNMIFGFTAIPLLFVGGLGFYYFWNQQKELQVQHLGEVSNEQVNSLVIYPDEIKFENVARPLGFIWKCLNDGQNYYIHIEDRTINRIVSFILPDQQYYDPQVFAERVLSLPCHKKIFERKQDLIHKLRPLFAGLVGVGIWVLILTTTGGGKGG